MNNNNLTEDESSFFDTIATPRQSINKNGEVKTNYTDNDEASFFDSLPDTPPEDKSFFGVVKQGLENFKGGTNEILRGGIKGIAELGEAVSATGSKVNPYAELTEDQANPEERMDRLRELLPSEESESTAKRERFGELAPAALAGPGGAGQALLRTALAVKGEEAGEIIGGKWGKMIGGILPFIAPNPTRFLQASNQHQQRMLDFGRGMGLSEEQLTLATKPDTWLNRQLAHFSIKRGPARTRIQQTQEGLGRVYEELEHLPISQNPLEVDQLVNFAENLETQMQRLPQNIRQQVMPDVMDFWNSNRTAADLMNLHHDINHVMMQHGNMQAGILKQAVTMGIWDVSPQLGQEFTLTNNLYANFARVRGQMQPGLVDDFFTGVKALSAATALVTGNYPVLASMVGVGAARSASTALILSPRLQNLQHKMLRALNENNISVANNILEQFKQGIKGDAPEYYELIKNESFPAVKPIEKKGEKNVPKKTK